MLSIDVAPTVSVPEGSEILSHINPDPPNRCWNPKNLTLYQDEEQKSPIFKGSTLLHRMKQREKALGAQYLDWLLKNPEEIPPEWARGPDGDDQYIFFWGTQYSRLSDGKIFIRYLYQTDTGLWREGRHFVDDVWLTNCVAVEWKN